MKFHNNSNVLLATSVITVLAIGIYILLLIIYFLLQTMSLLLLPMVVVLISHLPLILSYPQLHLQILSLQTIQYQVLQVIVIKYQSQYHPILHMAMYYQLEQAVQYLRIHITIHQTQYMITLLHKYLQLTNSAVQLHQQAYQPQTQTIPGVIVLLQMVVLAGPHIQVFRTQKQSHYQTYQIQLLLVLQTLRQPQDQPPPKPVVLITTSLPSMRWGNQSHQ